MWLASVDRAAIGQSTQLGRVHVQRPGEVEHERQAGVLQPSLDTGPAIRGGRRQ
jgi:hypothetical protein